MMYRILLLLTILLGCVFAINAQDLEKLPKFGKDYKEALAAASYPDAPDAEAVVLFEEGKVQLVHSGDWYDVESEYRVRVKVLTEEGKEYATVEIPYYKDDKVKDIKGVTVLPGGKKFKLDNDDIFEEKGENFHTIKFALPGVAVGSVFEYRFKTVSERIALLEPWTFQNNIYTLHSRFSVTVLPFFTYNAYFINMSEIEAHREEIFVPGSPKKVARYTWERRNLQPIREEPFMRAPKDYMAAIHFQLKYYKRISIYDSWESVAKRIQEYFEDFYSNAGELKAVVDQLTTSEMSPVEKYEALYSYVQNTIETSRSGGIDYDDNAKKVLENRKGKGNEKNLLLVNLLRLAGLNAYPMLISTRSHGRVLLNQPRFDQFNYTLAAVNFGSRIVVLDTRYKHYPHDLLPEPDIVEYGLPIADNTDRPVSLPEPRITNMRYSKATIQLLEDGSLQASASIRMEGYNAVYARQGIADDGQEAYVKTLLEHSFPTIVLDSVKVEYLENPEQPVHISAYFQAPEYAQVVGNMVYLTTPSISKMPENPFKRETRYFPIEFVYNVAETDDIDIVLPEGFDIAEMPKAMLHNKSTHKIRFATEWDNSENGISFKRSYLRQQLVYGAGAYGLIRDFYDQMVSADQEQLVIQRETLGMEK